MKREVVFVLLFISILPFLNFTLAAEEDKVELGYSCLEKSINQTGCSSLNFEGKVFAYLASGLCGKELSEDNQSNQCWPKAGCKLKSTAQAILALNKKTDMELAEKWLLKQTAVPSGIDWFLEIEVPSGETTCQILYPGSPPAKITIRENKTLSSGAGSQLKLAQGGYWLRIDPSLYNKEIYISCERQFITTLLFTKSNSQTIHVSETVSGAGAGGNVSEKVTSLCFAQNGVCNYEGSLWAALVLTSRGYHEEVQNFLPYLITMKDEPSNSIYIPESFLYYLTNKFRVELLLKQKYSSYWEESGNRYYDTALALLPLASGKYDENSNEKSNAKEWLLSVQQKNGCWNNGNIRDTAFLLYSIWPKNPFSPVGECEYNWDCPRVDCKYAWCEKGVCKYEYDGSCIGDVICKSDSDCPAPEYSENFCDGNTVYRETYTFSCETSKGTCKVRDTKRDVIKSCSKSEKCEDGKCIQDSCSYLNPCPKGYDCVSGSCIEIGGECKVDSECEVYNYETDPFCSDKSTVSKSSYTYFCNTKKLVCEPNKDKTITLEKCSSSQKCDEYSAMCVDKDEPECDGFLKWCPSGYKCSNGKCILKGGEGEETPKGQCEIAGDCDYKECKVAECIKGTCLWEYVECKNNDFCCSPGCNYSNDNDCGDPPECTSDSDCVGYDYDSSPFCDGKPSNYKIITNLYNYTCVDFKCSPNISSILVEDCLPSQDCYSGTCYNQSSTCECVDNYGCSVGYKCVDCECVKLGKNECIDSWNCGYDEDCVNEKCVPLKCTKDGDCYFGLCVDGECAPSKDCKSKGYYCKSKSSCDAGNGDIMQDYSCKEDLLVCCSKDSELLTCEKEGGIICAYNEVCVNGASPMTSDIFWGEVCCVGGKCSSEKGGSDLPDNSIYCVDEGGRCASEGYCESNEVEKPYLCDSSYQSCCIKSSSGGSSSGKSKKGGAWVIIIILLILIILAVLGIVFRDKVRTEWMKVKNKLSGKKSKKTPQGPPGLPSSMQPNSQGRISPRRILPPGQSATGQAPPGSKFPMRTVGPPMSMPPSQPPRQTPLARTSPTTPPQTTPTQQPQTGTQSKTPEKKKDEKSKEDLDDVLKRLREMGDK